MQNADRVETDRRRRAGAVLEALLSHYRIDCLDHEALTDALFLETSRGGDSLIGISEFSVSFTAGAQVSVRALAEILHRRTLDAELALRCMRHTEALLKRLSARCSRPYAIPLFSKIYRMMYLMNTEVPAPRFRFGVALEFNGAALVVKTYFDLFAVNKADRRTVLEHIADLTGESEGLRAWQNACPDIDLDTTRIIGIDFRPGGSVRTKFYWSARTLNWSGIADTLRHVSGEQNLDTLERLQVSLGCRDEALLSMLVSMAGADDGRSMKLDVCLARVFENDGPAFEAVQRFRTEDGTGPTPFAIVTAGLRPHQTKHVHQYLSVAFARDKNPKTTIYYRLPGMETEHLSNGVRPAICTQ